MLRVRFVSLLFLWMASGAGATEPLPQGAYAIDAALQIPNVNGPSWKATRYVCLGPGKSDARMPIPVLSPNNPFGACGAEQLVRTDSELRYHIGCPGRGAARAEASYRLGPDGFRGQIEMVLGAKNMTLTEFQTGHRLGDCEPSTAAAQP